MDNYIINGSQRISQYNFANTHPITPVANHVIDRFYAVSYGANSTGAWINGDNTHKKVYSITGGAGVTSTLYGTRLTSEDTKELSGSTVCLGVDIASSSLAAVDWELYYGSANNTFGTVAVPNRTLIATGTFAVNGTMSRYSADINLPVAATTGLEVVFKTGALTGNVHYSHISLRKGAGNSEFVAMHKPLELIACQHFYEKSFIEEIPPMMMGTTNDGEHQFIANMAGANLIYTFVNYKEKKFRNSAPDNRVQVATYNPKAANNQAWDIVANTSCSNIVVENRWDSGFRIRVTGAPNTQVNNVLGIHWTAKSEIVI